MSSRGDCDKKTPFYRSWNLAIGQAQNACNCFQKAVSSSCLEGSALSWLSIFLIFLTHSLGAQPTVSPKKFPTTAVNVKFTDVVLDSNNHIWVGSFGTLERYDGTLVKRYDGKEQIGLLYRLFVDNRNRVWSIDMNSGFSYMDRDSIQVYQHNGQVKHLSDDGNLRTMSFHEDDRIKLASDYFGYYEIDSSGALTNILRADGDLNGWVYIEGKEGQNHCFFALNADYGKEGTFNFYLFDEQRLRFTIPIAVSDKVNLTLMGRGRLGDVTKDIDGNYLISFGGYQLLRVSPKGQVEKIELDHSVYEIFIDSKGEAWISSVEGVVYQYPLGALGRKDKRRIYFGDADGSDKTVVRCEDHEYGVWMAREEAGIFHIADRRHGVYDIKSGHLISDETMTITRAGDDIVLGFRGKNAITVINSSTHKTKLHTNLKGFSTKSQCTALCYDSLTNRLWVGDKGTFGYYNYPINSESEPERVYSNLSYCYGLIQKENSALICALGAKSFTLLMDTFVVYRSDTFKKLLTDASFTPEGKLNIGSRGEGVRIFSFDSNYQASITHIPAISVSSLTYAFGKTWVVSSYKLYTINNNDQLEPFVVDTNNKVGVSSVYAFRNSLWVTFGRGIYRVKKGVSGSGYEIEAFPFASGLASVLKSGILLVHKRKIYSAAFGGIPIYDFGGLQSFERFESPMVDRLYMNGYALPRKPSYTFDYKQNSMNIELTAPHYQYGFQRFFRYKLLHSESDEGDWIELNKPGLNTLNFSHLSHGNYRLKAQIGASSLAWSNPMEMDIRILPPYWQTWWFRGIILFGFTFIVWLAASYRYRTRQRQMQLELDAMAAHQKALRSQINPHFVFNVIASVQYLVKSSPGKAAKFLGHFSSLIRKVLDHSFVQWVPLQSELDQLEDYLALERMRMNDSFEYEIDTKKLEEPKNLLVPPALLQPYIENAVWHGLKANETGGKMSIKLHSEGESLQVIIEDNGPGRHQGGENNHKGHKSYGMLLSAERIKALNAEQGSFASVEVKDLKNNSGLSSGTRVKIKLRARFDSKTDFGSD